MDLVTKLHETASDTGGPLKQITGSGSCVGLGIGDSAVVTVDHSATATFGLPCAPEFTVPTGVNVRLLCSSGLAPGSGFSVEVVNVSYDAETDVAYTWTRTGILAAPSMLS